MKKRKKLECTSRQIKCIYGIALNWKWHGMVWWSCLISLFLHIFGAYLCLNSRSLIKKKGSKKGSKDYINMPAEIGSVTDVSPSLLRLSLVRSGFIALEENKQPFPWAIECEYHTALYPPSCPCPDISRSNISLNSWSSICAPRLLRWFLRN